MSHGCENLVITCMDYRFGQIYQSAINKLGASDRVALAGAAKAIVDEDTREATIKQIDLSLKLHGIQAIYLLDHEDCGGYGGKKAVSSDEEEIKVHQVVAKQAREIIKQHFPDLEVVTQLTQLDGQIINL